MNEKNEKKKKIKTCLGITGLIICTIIGGYGIFHAPASDQSELEQELLRNEQALEETNSTPPAQSTDASPAAQTSVPETQQPDAEEETKQTISVIGDSVFLGASPSFQELHKDAVIDAKISRQVYQAIDVAKKLDKKNKLGNTIIISLGTNGKFNPATGQELLDYLGPDRTIYWINAYGNNLEFQSEVNDTIQKLAKEYSNVHVISWDKEGKKHPDWFYQDGVHLNTKGQEGFAQFVEKKIGD